jgi:hypothetical protein
MPSKIGGLVQCVGRRADFDFSDTLEDLARQQIGKLIFAGALSF